MKTGFIKIITLLGYLGLIFMAAGLSWEKFMDIRILLLVITGTFILAVPELLKKKRSSFMNMPLGLILLAGILERQSINAGLLLSFLLLFSDSSQAGSSYEGIFQAVLCFRPLFYGYCIYILLHVEKVPEEVMQEDTVGEDTVIPQEDEYSRLRNLGLTNREAEIAGYLLHGRSNHEIAETLTISEATVKKHISNIFQKLNIGRREQISEVLTRKEE